MRLIYRVPQMVTLNQKLSHWNNNGHPNNGEIMQNLCRTNGNKIILFIFPLLIKGLDKKPNSWHRTCNYIGMDRNLSAKRTVAQSGSDSSLQKGISRDYPSQIGKELSLRVMQLFSMGV